VIRATEKKPHTRKRKGGEENIFFNSSVEKKKRIDCCSRFLLWGERREGVTRPLNLASGREGRGYRLRRGKKKRKTQLLHSSP